jgi:serine/threonine protein kinase
MSQHDSGEETIFEAARQLDDSEKQAAYLDLACDKDHALRQRIEQLLRAGQKAKDFFQKQRPPLLPSSPQPPTVRTIGEGPGSVIGPYKLLQQIGEGGCGVVYMAEQEEPICRQVALKVVKLGMDTKEVMARFDAERQALALMDHPNIAKVLDAGATDTGRPFFVMELVRGIRITDYCDQNKLSTNERLTLFMQVCRAVQHAHQKGIIHRDLKPSNILVASNDGVPVPKVIDFGIAKATQGRLTDQTVFTAFAQFIGTPAYMSPEQAEMTMLDIDTRTDIYALGVLLYELLTGRTPFDAKELLAAGLDEMRRTIREVEPVKPSTRLTQERVAARAAGSVKSEIRNQKSEIAQDLDWIVMKCLEKDRARRYDTANGLAMDVQHYLADEAVLARPPSNLYRFQKLVRRNKLAFAAGGAVLAALLIGLGISTWMYFQEKAARQRAVAAEYQANQARASEAAQRRQADEARAAEAKLRAQAQSEASKSQQVAEFLKRMIESVGPAVALGRDTAMLREILDKTADRIGTDLTNQPEVEMELRGTLANTYHELGMWKDMELMARKRLELARTRMGEQSEHFARALTSLGDALWHVGRLEESEKLIREALALHKELWAHESTSAKAVSLELLAHILAERGDLAEAEKLDREALTLQKKLFGNENAGVANALHNLVGVLVEERKLEEAETLSRAALAMRQKLYGKEHPDIAFSLHNLGMVLFSQHKLAEAETTHRQALAMRQKLLGNDHPSLANSMHNLAVVLCDEGKYPEAETWEHDALALRRKLFGDEHRDVARGLRNLSKVLWREGKLPEAETVSRDLLARDRQRLGNEHEEVVEALEILAHILALEGKLAEAETNLLEALPIVRKTAAGQPSQESTHLALVLHHLADVRRRQKALPEALALAKEAYAMYQHHPNWLPDEQQHSERVLADVLRDLGDLAGVEAVFREQLTRAQTLATNAPSGETYDLGLALYDLAGLLRKSKARAEARSFAEQATAMYQRHPEWPSKERQYAVWVLADVVRELGDFDALEAVRRHDLNLVQQLSTNGPAGEIPILGVALYELANVLRERKSLEESQSLAEAAIAAYQRHPDWPLDEREYAFATLADVLRDRGDLLRREAVLRAALTSARALSTNAPLGETSSLGLALHHLAHALRQRKALTEARSLAEEAAAMYRRHPEWPPREIEGAFAVLAEVLRDLGDLMGLEAVLRDELTRVRKLCANAPSGETSDLARAMYHLADVLRQRKALPEAQSLGQQAVAMFQRHPEWPPTKRQHAVAILEQVLRERGDFGGLEALLQDEIGRLRTLSTNAPSGETSNLGVALSKLANVLRKGKSFSQAQSLAEEAIAMYHRHPDWPSDERESAFSVLAAARLDLADEAGAEAAYREILQSLRARLAPDDPELTGVLAQLTLILLEEKKFTQAEPLARECLEIREKKVPDDWRTFNSRSLLGGALLGQKNYADAEPLLMSGYAGMKQRGEKLDSWGGLRVQQALQRLVQLYQDTNQPEKAAEWKKKLAQLDQAER